jgi:hypothetical protein
MLVLDWIGADRSRRKVSSGVTLEYLARSGLGLPAEHLRPVRDPEMLSIRSVKVLDDYWLRLTLSDGTEIERSVRELLWGPVFQCLRTDYSLFRRARVRHGTVEWPGDLDLAPEVLIWGPDPQGAVGPPLARLALQHPGAQRSR